MRPCASVAGTRCTRWPPDSNLSLRVDALSPTMRAITSLVAAQLAGDSRHHLDLPALALGVARVHAEQVAGEQRRLVAAGAGADFEEDVARRRPDRAAAARLQLAAASSSAPAIRSCRRDPPSSASSPHRSAMRSPRGRVALAPRSAGTASTSPTRRARGQLAIALHVADDRPSASSGVELVEARARRSSCWREGGFMADTSRRRVDGRRVARAQRASSASLALVVAGWRVARRAGTALIGCASRSRSSLGGVAQLGERAVQHLLGQAARERLEHRVDVSPLASSLRRARDLERAPVVGLGVAAPDQRHRAAPVASSARSSARRSSMIASACATAASRGWPGRLHQRRQVVDGVEVDVVKRARPRARCRAARRGRP